jgi:heme oxygenase
MADLGPLHKATRDLHHSIEQTPFGKSMATGEVGPVEWTIWLKSLFDIHYMIDNWAPNALKRADEVKLDLLEMYKRGYTADSIDSVLKYLDSIKTEEQALGAIYVLGGAHVMGGAIIQKQINGKLPCSHLIYPADTRKEAVSAVRNLRDRIELSEDARECFKVLISIAEHIQKTIER